MLHSALLYKLGEGPINYNWNQRYFVLDEEHQEMTYYDNEEETKPKSLFVVKDALVSNIT